MTKPVGFTFSLQSIPETPLKKKAVGALAALCPIASDTDVQITINGHAVQIGTNQFYFEAGAKKVYQLIDGQRKLVDEKLALPVRRAVKALANYAYDLGRIVAPDGPQFVVAPVEKVKMPAVPVLPPTEQNAKAALNVLFPLADFVGIIRNLLDLIQVIGVLSLTPWFLQTVDVMGHAISKSALIFGQAIAGFRLFQGCLMLGMGIGKLYVGYKAYARCKANHDAAGMAIEQHRMISGGLNIAAGVMWLTLGIFMLACPQVMIAGTAAAIAFMVLQWVLFYGVFASDSIVLWRMAGKTLPCIERHYQYFMNEIANNPSLTDDQKRDAAKRFLVRLLRVTELEEAKIREKVQPSEKEMAEIDAKVRQENPQAPEEEIPQIIQGLVEERIQARLSDKGCKKSTDLARALDLKDLNLDSPNLVSEIQTRFRKSLASQHALRLLVLLCLTINLLGIQSDFPALADLTGMDSQGIIGSICHVLTMPGKVTSATLDFGWVLMNQLFWLEETPQWSLFTRFFQRLESDEPLVTFHPISILDAIRNKLRNYRRLHLKKE